MARRYGYTGYGGFGNDYPAKEQPGAYRTQQPRDTFPQIALAPPDMMPRRPSRPVELPPPIAQPGDLFDPEAFIDRLLYRLRATPVPFNTFDAMRYAQFKNLGFIAGVGSTMVLEKATDLRTYLFVQNTHPLNTLFVTFQTNANANIGVPLAPAGVGGVAGGFYELFLPCPQDAINVLASAPATTGVLVFAELDPRVLTSVPGPR